MAIIKTLALAIILTITHQTDIDEEDIQKTISKITLLIIRWSTCYLHFELETTEPQNEFFFFFYFLNVSLAYIQVK